MAELTLDYAPMNHAQGEQIIRALHFIGRTQAHQIQAITDWSIIKEMVRDGLAPDEFPVHSQLIAQNTVLGNVLFDVIGHNHDKNPHDESAPTMTLLMHYCVNSRQFDAPEAIIYCETALEAGTYYFTLEADYDTANDGGKNVQFTLTQGVPAGGQIVMNWPTSQTWIGKNVTTYASGASTTAIETAVMSEGSSGTFLGTTGAGDLNNASRARFGSNNAAESAVYCWLNSDAAAGSWWTPSNKFDRSPAYASAAGFMNGFDSAFLAAIGEVDKPNRTNGIFDMNGTLQSYTQRSKFFLLSNEEVGFATESNIDTGHVYDFFRDAQNIDRIKYDMNAQTTARVWWLRTPYPSSANSERHVNTSGALNHYSANIGYAVAAACVIY